MIITNEAKDYLLKVLKENHANSIKVYDTGGGCCGPAIGIALDKPGEDDIVEEVNSIQVAFEKAIYYDTKKATIDLQQGDEGEGLILKGITESC
ncbi:adhesin [Salipaludibacillus sp. LMS25]|jgi:Fe-S cluster assembly iron-binding protein IscA|uniref:adhesin n=1 Tax=Salipaludibacillus sp. LMS25 TaxID=2924031 RepID=UPI0020D19731|nr:adhesin [Salipaludibacillus sp. LMS25]UTR13956.1 adhesin [Salipaludibacillus sp. LMS25]